jgi:hypothetical protein
MKKNILVTLIAVTSLASLSLLTFSLAQDPIPAKEELVKPATVEKRFSSYWVRNFQVRASSPTEKGTFYIELLPYNAETKEVDATNPKELQGDLWELVSGSPKSAVALGAVFAAVPEIEAFIDAQKAAAAAEAPQPEPQPE